MSFVSAVGPLQLNYPRYAPSWQTRLKFPQINGQINLGLVILGQDGEICLKIGDLQQVQRIPTGEINITNKLLLEDFN